MAWIAELAVLEEGDAGRHEESALQVWMAPLSAFFLSEPT